MQGSGWESENRDRGPTACLAANAMAQVPKLRPGEVSGLPGPTGKVVGRDVSSDLRDSGSALLPRYREAGAFFLSSHVARNCSPKHLCVSQQRLGQFRACGHLTDAWMDERMNEYQPRSFLRKTRVSPCSLPVRVTGNPALQ